jgi:hypothetical protein
MPIFKMRVAIKTSLVHFVIEIIALLTGNKVICETFRSVVKAIESYFII